MGSVADGLVLNFNTAMRTFLYQLSVTFPEQKDVANFYATFDTFVSLMPAKPMEVFMEAVSPHAALLTARDPRLFAELDFPGIDFRAMWESPGVTEATHDAIWQHLSVLYAFGSVAKGVTPEVAGIVEDKLRACLNPDNSVDAAKAAALVPELVASLQDNKGVMDLLKHQLQGVDLAEVMAGMQDLANNIDPSALQGLIDNLDTSALANLLGGSGGLDPSALAGLLGGGGGLMDPSMIAGLLGGGAGQGNGDEDMDLDNMDLDMDPSKAPDPATIINMLRGMDGLLSMQPRQSRDKRGRQ